MQTLQGPSPRPAFSFVDWIFPQALAATNAPTGSHAAAMLALGGLSSNLQCLSDSAGNCGRFMGALSDLGAVGGFASTRVPAQVFCSVAAHGGPKFNLSSQDHALLGITSPDDEALGTSATARNAATQLLNTCADKTTLSAMNAAFAYPATTAGGAALATRVPGVPNAATAATGAVPTSVPTSAPSAARYETPTQVEDGTGAAR